MKKIFLLLMVLFSMISVVGCTFEFPTSDEPTTENKGTFQLLAPYVTVSEAGVASWEAVPYAVGYSYTINNGAMVNTTNTSVTLSNGDTFKVMAIGDGITYSNSDFSNVVTFGEPITNEPTKDEPTEDEPTQDLPTQNVPTEDEPTQDEPTEDVIDLTKITLGSVQVTYDGEEHSIYVSNLPANYTAEYTGNGVSALGTYTVTAKVYDADGNLVKELTATITIVDKYDVELPLV